MRAFTLWMLYADLPSSFNWSKRTLGSDFANWNISNCLHYVTRYAYENSGYFYKIT